MVKLDYKTLREMTGVGKGESEEKPGKDIDPIKLQRMKLEEAQWKALYGGGSEEKSDTADPVDLEVAKMMRDMRSRNVMRMMKNGGDDDEGSATLRALQKEIEELKRNNAELERKRQEEEKDRRQEERFRKLEEMIANSVKKGNGSDEDALSRTLKEIEKMREEDRKERERLRDEEAKERERSRQIDDLRDEMADHQSRLETMLRDGATKKDKGFIAELREFQETQKALESLTGKKEAGGESLADSVDQIIDKGPKLAQSVRSIYDMAKGREEEDIDIGPMETMPENETPRGRTVQPSAAKPEIERYVDEGYEIDDPDHPGNKMFVGAYKDYYIGDDGKPLSRSAVALIAKTHPEMLEPTVEKAKQEYYAQKAKQAQQAEEKPTPPPPPETKPEIKPEIQQAKDKDEEEPAKEEDA